MNIFKTGKYTWWQIGTLKVALLCIGIAIGAYLPEFFLPFAPLLAALGIVLGLYLLMVWVRQV